MHGPSLACNGSSPLQGAEPGMARMIVLQLEMEYGSISHSHMYSFDCHQESVDRAWLCEKRLEWLVFMVKKKGT